MYGLAVNLIVSVSGHPWIIDEMMCLKIKYQTQQYALMNFVNTTLF